MDVSNVGLPPHPPRTIRKQAPFECEPSKQFSLSHETHKNEHMPSIYHLHRTPSEPDLGIITPPASPPRRFDAPYTKLREEDMAGVTCSCGHAIQPASPRGSMDGNHALPLHLGSEQGRTDMSAASGQALAPQRGRTTSHAPMSGKRNPSASGTDLTKVARPMRAATIKHSDDHWGPIIPQLAGPSKPTISGQSDVRAYSPMAAGFARLGHREGPSHSHQNHVDQRRGSETSSLELHARMFDGAA
ncbi:hypothetical protein D0865_09410 [Hortaea werneckii]|uniref:Uncharacterized protein n=1 Tax=Hortaea werneckii TaxID=91943 RepID=A0A3M7C2B5_HORWE|nr:hypothetical protein D0865_09410 [Hortaea werneckii]